MATSGQPFRAILYTVALLFMGCVLSSTSVDAASILDLADIIAHPDQYARGWTKFVDKKP